MDGATLNWAAVIVAATVGFVIGGLWYSPLLMGRPWMAAAGLSEEQVAGGNRLRIFGGAFVALLIISVCLAGFLASPAAVSQTGEFFNPSQQGAFYGFLTGFGVVFCALVVVGLFEQRPLEQILINGAYWIITLTAMGGILGGWI